MKKQRKQAAIQGEACEDNLEFDEEVDMAAHEDDEGSDEEMGSGPDQARRVKVTKKKAKPGSKAPKMRPKAKACPTSEPKKQAKARSTSYGAYEAGKYATERNSFVAKLKKMGLSFKQANSQWLVSSTRKAMLKDMPLPELKRRRFVGKDVTTHPFRD